MALVKTIESFSDGQATLSENETDSDSLNIINVTITPSEGLYKNGKFNFEIDISDGYPEINPPKIRCLNKVYHPNIDQIDDYSEGDICLNLLDELWTPDLTLEDYVQGLLFMFYEPNIEDPLNPAFGGDEDEEKLRYNVRQSMRGIEIDGLEYENVLPDGYESDNGETYKDEYKGTSSKRGDCDSSDSDNDSVCSEISPSLLLDDNDNSLMVYNANKTEEPLPSIDEVDEATGQQVVSSTVNVKPFSSVVSVVLRFLRFLKPQPNVADDGNNLLVLRSKLGSVFVISVTFLALRFGMRIFTRSALFHIAK